MFTKAPHAGKVRLDYSKLDGPDEDEGDLSDYIRHRHQPPPG